MLSQTVVSMTHHMQVFFQMQQASGSRSQHVVPTHSQHDEENDDEDKDGDKEYDIDD